MTRSIAATVAAGLTAFLWTLTAAAQDATACLARPTVTCSVDLALAASANGHDDDERARLAVRAGTRLMNLAARKAYLDRVAARFFASATAGPTALDRERRIVGIAAAIVAGDNATADRLLDETKGNFQRWWETLAAVIERLAATGKPDFAIASETQHHRTVTVSKTDALGRKLGDEVWTTRQPLARALVRCNCGPDPLPMVLALPNQTDRVGLAAILYARRHDVGGLTSLLTREFGTLADVTDKTRRNWVGYGFGLMLRALPMQDIPAALRKAPAWLTAENFERPADFGMPGHANTYGDVLAHAIENGNRDAVTAIVKLRPRGDTVWLSETKISSLDAAATVEDALPRPERDHLRLHIIKSTLAHGDARKGVNDAMKASVARRWRKTNLGDEEAAEFETTIVEPLLARGAFDVAEDAVKRLRDTGARKALRERIATARTDRAAVAQLKNAATAFAAQWGAYQKTKDADAGRAFLFAVRDRLAAQPDALPFQ